ncbi:MAG: dipeptidase, partial [Pacificimonas sp.]
MRYIPVLIAAACLAATPAMAQDELERARAILADAPVFDGHNDLPYAIRRMNESRISDFPYAELDERFEGRIATDAAKLKAGGLGAQFWSVYVPASLPEPEAVVQVVEQIDLTERLMAANPDTMAKASTAADIRRIMASGRVAGMYGIEGGHAIANSLGVLRQLYDLGARYMTLTHSTSLDWVDSATDEPKSGGLSDFGREVVREMNRLGMLVDLSHVSPDAMRDSLEETVAPVIFSHSSARAITDHPRNVPDDVLRLTAENGGVVMVTYVEGFVNEATRAWWAAQAGERSRLESLFPYASDEQLGEMMADWREANPQPKATIGDVADHIDHMRDVMGVDHVGIGGDFDGIPTYPVGLEDVSTYPALFAELLRRGYSEAD